MGLLLRTLLEGLSFIKQLSPPQLFSKMTGASAPAFLRIYTLACSLHFYYNRLAINRREQTFSIMAAPAPQLLRDYLIYMSTIKGRSPRTVEAYYNDLRLFLRYLMATRSGTPLPTDDPNLESISFASISEEMILSARLSDAYSFLAYVQSVNQNNAKTRARKVSSLRGFYKYLQSKAGRLEENPMEQLEIPAQRKSLPKYLTLDESLHLLESIEGKDRERDYCIITILLNCGIRLSELVGIKLSDIRDDTLTVLGKGNKERMVYLNSACLNAIAEYLAVRPEPPKDADKPYLLVSSRTRAPLTPRRVEQIVETHLKAAGLGGRGYSPHKLRHTAATLMYQYGGVDIRVLKEILGHVNLGTTEIYTHVSNDQIANAADRNPLSHVKSKPSKKEAETE